MKLTIIAHDMKTRAQAAPGEIIVPKISLVHGARLKLKYDADTHESRLQVQRSIGKQGAPRPGTAPFAAWRRELETFARDFGAGADARASRTSKATRRTRRSSRGRTI